MSRHLVLSSVAVVILALGTWSNEAAARTEGGVHARDAAGPHRSARRVHARHVERHVARAAAPADPWADWAARWSAEVGNCPVGWYCYPMGNK
jgi:hypothetical protein